MAQATCDTLMARGQCPNPRKKHNRNFWLESSRLFPVHLSLWWTSLCSALRPPVTATVNKTLATGHEAYV